MNRRLLIGGPLPLVAVGALAAGCGSGASSNSAPTTSPPATAKTASGRSTAAPASQGPGALKAEARQTAAGDIPDNQMFLTFRNTPEGYFIKYPEGWAQRGSAERVTFQDKNNLVRIEIAKGSGATMTRARTEMKRISQNTPSLRFDLPIKLAVGNRPLVKVTYSTESAPNPVTGKRVKLVVDRYYVPGSGKHAIIDLGTPQGVDNVDAYRLMIESFRWR